MTETNHKILILNGATRINGNTDISIKTIVEGAKATGITIDQINLRDKKIGDCIGCTYCHDHDRCSIKDDVPEIQAKINESSLLVFASPIYWWGVTGKMKTLIDRLYFYHSPHNKKLIAGKKAIVVSPMNMNSDIYKIDIYKQFFDILFENLDITLVGRHFFGNVNKKGDIAGKPEYIAQLHELGENLNHY